MSEKIVDLRWSIGILKEIESISSYILHIRSEKASEIVKWIIINVEKLRQLHKRGWRFPDRDDERMRDILVKKHRIVHEINKGFIEILVIAHRSKLLQL